MLTAPWIVHDIFKIMLPALVAEHNFDFHQFSKFHRENANQTCRLQKSASRLRWGAHFCFYRLSKLRKRHANHNRLHFLRFGVPLEASWGRLEIILGRLGVNLGQTWVNLGELGPTWCQLGANLAKHGPT